MILPITLIMSYGFVKLLNEIPKKIIHIIFFITSIFTHAATYLIFWENIYFNSEKIWILPYDINFQKSISEPFTLVCSFIFLSFIVLIITLKLKYNYGHIKEN